MAVLTAGAAPARAATVARADLTFPSTVTVGASGLPASVTLTNANTGLRGFVANAVCNAGEGPPGCEPADPGVLLTPSCVATSGQACAPGAADPGVFALSSIGIGRAGSACSDRTFDILAVDEASGTVRFVPRPPGTHVLLGPGRSCIIDFTFGVARMPRADGDPGAPGAQTAQATRHTQYSRFFGFVGRSVARATTVTTVQRNPVSLTTQASADVALGAGALTDTAVVGGRVDPEPSATIDFRLYGPGDEGCAGPPVFEQPAVAYPVDGGPVQSDPFTPSAAGTYRWVATYSGDAGNAPAAGACGAAGETTVVSRAAPSIATVASIDVALGSGLLDDYAMVGGRVNPQAGGTIDFRLYGPDDPDCSGAPVFESLDVAYPVGDEPVGSRSFTPTAAGTYRWIASYGGDANNLPAAGVCGEAGESTVVGRAQPVLATTASPDITLGAGSLSDQATVSGRVNPQAGATVDIRLYGPDDPSCAGEPVFQTVGVSYPVAGGAVSSQSFTPSAAGVYRWVASYSGDANNAPVAGACGDADETSVVGRATPSVSARASDAITLGSGTLTDTATISGRVHPQPGAEVDFRLYGPGDTDCSAAPVFESLGVDYPVAGGAVTSAPFTPDRAGTYRWVASFSGDANNLAVATSCADAAQSTLVRSPPAAVTLAARASPDIVLGSGTLTDTASVGGRVDPQPGATVDFRLYGPDDDDCSGPAIFESLDRPYPVAGGDVTSAAFTPVRAGTYRWIASYSGDANNQPARSDCGDGGQRTLVSEPPAPPPPPPPPVAPPPVPGTPTLQATASPDVVLGAGELTDRVTVGGRSDPQAGATVAFRLYGPGDLDCTRTAVFATEVPYPIAGGAVVSPAFTPTRAGDYRWIAAYSGDASNAALAGACNDAGQGVTVARATPTIETDPSADAVLGEGSLSVRATLNGRVNPQPGATIDFSLHGPGDGDCSGAPVFESRDVPYPVAGGAVSSEAFRPARAGEYRWIAAYSGDANNAAVRSSCAAGGQRVSAPQSTTGSSSPPPPPPPAPPAAAPRDRAVPPISAARRVSPVHPAIPDSTPAPRRAHSPSAVSGSSGKPTPRAGDTRAARQELAPYDPRSEPEKTIGVLVAAFSLLQLATGAGGFSLARRGGGERDGGRATRTTPGSASQAGSGASFDLDYEGVDVEFLGAGMGAVAIGDRSRTWGWRGTRTLDSIATALPPLLIRRSPLLARVVSDGTYLRAMLGSASLIALLAGVALGIAAVHDTGGEALPPAATLTIAIAVLGVVDAAAGLAAVLTFTIGVVALGGVGSSSDVRLMLGLSALWFVVPLLAGAARPLRRPPTRSLVDSWDRAADFVIASLIGAWAVQKIVQALPGLAGLDLPIADHANTAALCVLAALALRLAFETITAHLYPMRLDRTEPGDLPQPGTLQRIGACTVRVSIFVFFAYVIVGGSWQLWVSAALFVVPQLLVIFEERFPNSPRLYAILPKGLVELVLMLFVVTALGALLVAVMDENDPSFLATTIVLLSLPGFALSILNLFGRDGEERELDWRMRLGGIGVLVAGILLALGMLL